MVFAKAVVLVIVTLGQGGELSLKSGGFYAGEKACVEAGNRFREGVALAQPKSLPYIAMACLYTPFSVPARDS